MLTPAPFAEFPGRDRDVVELNDMESCLIALTWSGRFGLRFCGRNNTGSLCHVPTITWSSMARFDTCRETSSRREWRHRGT